jgi:hypothetical protein
MKNDSLLIIASLLAIVLMSLHFADDIRRGFEPGGLTNLGGVAILTLWLCATVLFARRWWSYAILFLASLFAAVMPAIHMSGKGVGGAFAASSGAYFSIWLLIALGVTGSFSFILVLQALWQLRAKSREAARA